VDFLREINFVCKKGNCLFFLCAILCDNFLFPCYKLVDKLILSLCNMF